jgi:3-hydroxyacyl-CoA dehydrogenase
VKEDLKIFKTLVELTFLTPRYLKLFEIIPGPQTSSEVLILLYIWREIFRKLRLLQRYPAFMETVLNLRYSKFIPFG